MLSILQVVRLHCSHLTPSFPTLPLLSHLPISTQSSQTSPTSHPFRSTLLFSHIFISYSHQSYVRMPDKKQLPGGRVYLSSQFRRYNPLRQRRHGSQRMRKLATPWMRKLATPWELWEMRASAQCAFSFWHGPGVSAHERMLPATCFGCESSYLVKLFWKHPHRDTQKRVSVVILNPITLTG